MGGCERGKVKREFGKSDAVVSDGRTGGWSDGGGVERWREEEGERKGGGSNM